MKRTLASLSSALLLAGVLSVAAAHAQGVAIHIGDKVLVIPKEEARKVKETSKKAPRKGGKATNKKVGSADPPKEYQVVDARPPRKGVEELAVRYGLTKRTEQNPHLAFGVAELSYWRQQNLTEEELELEFEARRIILDAAERQKIKISDQEMLSRAAREFIQAVESEGEPIGAGAQNIQGRPPDVSRLICEGDTSQAVIRQAWEALNVGRGGLGAKELEKALACTKVAIDAWTVQADEQQAQRVQSGECKATPKPQDKDAYFGSSWALADVAAAWFIRGQVFARQKRWAEARESYKVLTDRYPCAYTWDPQGFFWRTAEGAERELKRLP